MFNATIVADAIYSSQSTDQAMNVIGNVYLIPIAAMLLAVFLAMILTAIFVIRQGAFKIAVIIAMGLVVAAMLFYLTFILPVIPKLMYDLSSYVVL